MGREPHLSSPPLNYNSPEYYRSLFEPQRAESLLRADEVALTQASEQLRVLEESAFTFESETQRISNCIGEARVLNFSDFDGTRSRLDDLGEQRNAEIDAMSGKLVDFEQAHGIYTIKVSGRPLVWPGIGLLQDRNNIPPITIGEAGSALAVSGRPSSLYKDFLSERTGYCREDLQSEIENFLLEAVGSDVFQLSGFRAQAQNQCTYKLSWDVQFAAGCDGDVAVHTLEEALTNICGSRAKVVQSHFIEARNAGIENTYRIDIVPGDKADATDFVADMLGEAGLSIPFCTAGDSGNDLALISAARNKNSVDPFDLASRLTAGEGNSSSNVFISVANAHRDLRVRMKHLAVPGEQFLSGGELPGVYFLMSEDGQVAKLLLDDAELPRFRDDLPADRYGPESILNAYAFLRIDKW